ncbi:MAG: 1-(5-phosphoribosyl)-5-[(5-phosphoribosylamino)methylideneamino]imidazole-4-carboxamide isomerase [Dehalococcoidia bacterium]|nr:1-(5-phosphoribosyl)-5-[(5-phosphoribosylamino)methylideneamino]imidazole-4-carboxamide isomerase [Dehalococcoidia bacterium]
MEVIPAIDIRGGRGVCLEQGDYSREIVTGEDPVRLAHRWAALGATRIHVVDLDGARDGRQANAAIVERIVNTVDCKIQTGGGIRDLPTLQATLHSGVDRAVIGTAAVKDPALLREAVALAGNRLIVSVDARNGYVSLAGWTESTRLDARIFIERLAAMGVVRVIYTDIMRDGIQDGPHFEMYQRLISDTSVAVIANGGVSTVEDVQRLADCGVEGAIINAALYSGQMQLREAVFAAS